MPKIYAFISSTNSINWDNTKAAIATHSAKFADGYQDFGAGNEAAVACPGCKRTLPLGLFSLDHIRPQSRYTPSTLGTLNNNDVALYSAATGSKVNTPGGDVRGAVMGGYMKVESGSVYAPKTVNVQSAEVWKNDLGNLQFLCPICNSSKGAKTFTEWGKPETDAKPLSAKL